MSSGQETSTPKYTLKKRVVLKRYGSPDIVMESIVEIYGKFFKLTKKDILDGVVITMSVTKGVYSSYRADRGSSPESTAALYIRSGYNEVPHGTGL